MVHLFPHGRIFSNKKTAIAAIVGKRLLNYFISVVIAKEFLEKEEGF